MPNVELSSKDIILLRELLARYYYDIRNEIAFTDNKDLRDFLKVREEFMRNLITCLEKIELEAMK